MSNSDLRSELLSKAPVDLTSPFEREHCKKPIKYGNKSVLTIIMQYASMIFFYISAFNYIIVHSTAYMAFKPSVIFSIVSGLLGIACVLVILIPQLACKNAAFVISLAAWSCILVIIWWLMIERIPMFIMICASAGCIILNFHVVYSICSRIDDLNGKNRKIAGETALVCLVPFYNIYWVYVKEKELVKNAQQCGITVPDRSIACLILNILVCGLISYCLMTQQLNRINSSLAPRRHI